MHSAAWVKARHSFKLDAPKEKCRWNRPCGIRHGYTASVCWRANDSELRCHADEVGTASVVVVRAQSAGFFVANIEDTRTQREHVVDGKVG